MSVEDYYFINFAMTTLGRIVIHVKKAITNTTTTTYRVSIVPECCCAQGIATSKNMPFSISRIASSSNISSSKVRDSDCI
jgi:hypothetical protein